ncbi:unnamed protein product [Euphydryas editha]|uniref:Telomere-associated protein RIF1 n=1 Tax=Euphydryas editha TaxID=104508 RepID=A0AAU9TFC7_EUPED|nr:unnamed protein product [Euphydryas editha]
MPDDQSTGTDLERLLDNLEDYTLSVHNYQSIQNALDAEKNIQISVIEKLLSVCARGLKEDMKNSVNMLNILATILKKIKTMQFTPLPDLVPSAIALLHILKTTAPFNKVEALKTLSFEIILSYPDETLIDISVNHSTELMELFNLYSHQRIPSEIRLQPINIIIKLLKILPPDKKTTFVKEGVSFWFSKIVPTITVSSALPNVLEALELLTDELIYIDYMDNPQWKVVFENIYTPQKYPALMKSLLETGSDIWHRLWIIFIKLLKNQITKSTNSVGSPINSMLPVVEMAFKMDVTNRCRAFSCWNVLIENFSTETNEIYINKRMKLLIIPLISNNAKVEDTAIAKLKTWWHLLSCFYSSIDKFSDMILMPFLQFCFGKSTAPDKPVIIPGMISVATKVQVVQAFINIMGHTQCEGCVALPKLKGKMISTRLLVSHWKDWIHALNNAIQICTENSEFSEEHIKCFWKSFLMTVGELPESNIRRDLFNEVLNMLGKLAEGCDNKLAETILNILIPLLFDKDDKIYSLLKSRSEQNAPIHKIISVINKLPLSNLENRQIAVKNLKVLGNFLIEEALKSSSHTIENILKCLPQNGLLIWTTLADTISESLYTSCPRMLCKMIIWPFKNMDSFVKDELATLAWFKTYKSVYSTLHITAINKDIINMLEANKNSTFLNIFAVNVAIVLLQQKIEVGDDYLKETDFLLKAINKINKIDEIIPSFASLVEVVILMLNDVCKGVKLTTAKNALLIFSYILKLSTQVDKDPDHESHVIKLLESVFKSLETTLKMDIYSKLKSVLLEELKNCAPYLKKQQTLKEHVLSLYKNTSAEMIEIDVKELIDAFESDDKASTITENDPIKESSDKGNFTTPSGKVVTKNQKKKETNIVKTVMENGEEFVVVKSNWKFNPRKLTDNQKEKLQRKREDIPALYQDLSQSQDEFKLTTWKTDSQDTTTTTSKSTSEPGNEDVSSILKNIPSSDFVPKILENIIGKDKAKTDQVTVPAKENTKIDINKEDNKTGEINKQEIAARETKSPRLALKDRVFRNVRNLIEKSNLANDDNELNSSLVENVVKTPSTKTKPPVNVTNSAPSLISADRPSRLKRKPKKFADLQLFGLKKRRHSSGQNDSPTDSEMIESDSQQTNISNDPKQEPELSIENEEKSKRINKQEIKNNTEEIITAVVDDNSKCVAQTTTADNTDIEDENKVKEDISTVQTTLNKDINIEINQNEEKNIDREKLNLSNEKLTEKPNDNKEKSSSNNSKAVDKNKLTDIQKSSKKSTTKKSRIEKELAIDMVEGHPFLKAQSEKRITRKAILNSPCTRKSLSEKNNKNKLETKSPKPERKLKEKSISIKETQNNSQDISESQDVIESSQESTLTTISVKSTKNVGKGVPSECKNDSEAETQSLLGVTPNDINMSDVESKDDTELPLNKTVNEKVLIDLTENIDTETINIDDEVIVINDDEDQSVPVNAEDKKEDQTTLNTACCDTQSLDPSIFTNEDENNKPVETTVEDALESVTLNENTTEGAVDHDITNASLSTTPTDTTKTMTESVLTIVENDLNSPFKDEEQRKKDFLNNTLEISPIKTLSPVREKKSPSPETSSDYVVIKLSSPVQSNGEPFEKIDSPEIFTEDKISPDKRDQSPPREEVNLTNNTSPSSSLSLKKNRPQARSGRAAQMLGLCVPDRLQTIVTSDKSFELDDSKKSPSLNTSARRNLRILYNSTTGETHDNSDEQDDSDNFLKLKRNLPATDCSPSGPILKRKLAEITDEATASPASKRKRVSFHDPPVSTTICVKKYIEPSGVRSPQNSAIKRQERQLRSQLVMKSPKRLENVFKLDSVLTKTVESFTEINTTENTNEDSEMSSLDQTPVAQVIKTADLNDTDPICPELVDCKDPIVNIAGELSSPAMRVLLIKVLEGKIETVGDLAKLTELEINRLCIKAPKVQVAKKVLNEYLIKMNKADKEITAPIEAVMNESEVTESNPSVEVQTNQVILENIEMQTDELILSSYSTQTDSIDMTHCSVQTDESGSKTTAEAVICLLERSDFVENLCEKIDESSKKKIVDNLNFNALTDMLMNKLTSSNAECVLDKVIEQKSKFDTQNENNKDRRLTVVQDYLCKNFESKDLVLFCSDLLKKVYEKR